MPRARPHLPRARVALLLLLGGAVGCASNAGGDSNWLHFNSRVDAIAAIGDLLRRKDWPTLARYYDLSGSGVDRATLESGEFFYDSESPASGQRDDRWRYRHPFAPGARIDHEMGDADPNVVVVVMVLDAVPGADGRPQRVYRFKMKRHEWGWRILPDPVDE